MLNPIIFAVPVFLAMMAIEFVVDRRRQLGVYQAADTVGSLSLGIVSQLVGGVHQAGGAGHLHAGLPARA